MLGPSSYTTTLLVPVSNREKKAAETIWHTLNVVSTYQNTLNFLVSLVIFRGYFTGNGKVSFILATISI